MIVFLLIIFVLNAFIIFHAMIGYPILLKVLDKIIKPKPIVKKEGYEPTISYMIVAHNEEAVIEKKLDNAIQLDYPPEKMQIIVASDNSDDSTNKIVERFIDNHPERKIILFCSKEHKGKTNVQNEAQKVTDGEILVMTDANTILYFDAIKQLVSYFSSENIVYVCGKLEYSNSDDNFASNSESTYWDLDLSMRDIESRIWTITAGNGALYACRNNEYIDFAPIACHDSIMPFTYSKRGLRAVFNPNAIAVEKAGETYVDEYKRKVRMNRDLFDMLFWGVSVLNPFKYRWFSVFYFGHRTCRYLLWIAHILLLLTSLGLALCGVTIAWSIFVLQIIFYMTALIAIYDKTGTALIRMIGYYGMTVFAQMNAVINIITGKAKPVWEKVESTR